MECSPTKAPRDTYSCGVHFTGEPLFLAVKDRVQSLRRIGALLSRDFNRTGRLDPPIWEDSSAARLLDMPSLPKGTRRHYKNLLHEWHWTAEISEISGRAYHPASRTIFYHYRSGDAFFLNLLTTFSLF